MSQIKEEPESQIVSALPSKAHPAQAEESSPHHISPGKLMLMLLVLAVLVAAVGLFGYLPRKARENAANTAADSEKTTLPTVTTARVRRAATDSDLTLPGSLSALVESPIYARASGYVRKRYVDIGDRVREGHLMAEIDAPELDQQVAQARAAVSQADQQLGQTKAAVLQAASQRDLAKITSERYNSLIVKGAVARQDADIQESNYHTADALVSAQESTMRAAVENVKEAQANLDRVISLQDFKNVRAPFAGIVTARNVDAGALISAAGGGQGASPNGLGAAPAANGNEMFRVAQVGTIRILISVPQAASQAIHTGMPAQVTVNELPGRLFNGKVTRTTNSLDQTSRTLLVEVQVANTDGKLLPGMYSEVRFRNHRDSPPLLVPGDALITTNAGIQIAVLQDGGEANVKKIHMQAVRIGRDFGAETEVIGGLRGDETVVVNPGDDVKEGAQVKAESEVGSGRGAAKQ